MPSKSFSVFLIWFITNTLLIRFVFSHGFENDPGIVSSLFIMLFITQFIALLVGKMKS